MSVITPGEVLDEARLLYSQLSGPRTPWEKLKHANQKQKYIEIAAFTLKRERAHGDPKPQEINQSAVRGG